MSLSSLLSQVATVESRRAGEDRFGQPLEEWTLATADVPCRLRRSTGRGEVFGDKSQGQVKSTHVLYADADAPITEAQRIGQVADFHGTIIAQDLDILHVRKVGGGDGRIHHLEVACQLYRDDG